MNNVLAFSLVTLTLIVMQISRIAFSSFINSKPTGRQTVLGKSIIYQTLSFSFFVHEKAKISVHTVQVSCVLTSVHFITLLFRIVLGPLPYWIILFNHYNSR